MVLRKEELVLYALSQLDKEERPNVRFSKEQVANALDINISTLDLYLSKMRKAGSIKRHKKKYVTDFRQTYDILPPGMERLEKILSSIEAQILTPERHNTPSIVPVSRVLSRIDDTLEKVFFLSLYSKVPRFDLLFYLETIKTAKQDTNIINLIGDLETDGRSAVPVVETFFKTCFFGDINACPLDEIGTDHVNVNTLLLVAEASYKQGRFREAMTIYDHVLSGKMKITLNQWFIARVGKALLVSKEGRTKEALEELAIIIDEVDNKIFKTYVKQVMARVESTAGNKERALEMFNQSIHSFTVFGTPLLLSISYNNRGVLHFRLKDHKLAEKDWKKALKFAKEAKSQYLEAVILPNLADIRITNNDLETSARYLDKAREIFIEKGDYEGVAIVNFNYSLQELARKDLSKALMYFHRSENLAYPSPSPSEKNERRKFFLERAKENGFSVMEDEIQ